MIAAIIVVGAIGLGFAYGLLWWLRPELRRRIEAPGHRFAADARRYDERCGEAQADEPTRAGHEGEASP